MVAGLELFKERFAAYADSYVLIGGAACYVHEEASAQMPRATKDLDVVLVVEALSADLCVSFGSLCVKGAMNVVNEALTNMSVSASLNRKTSVIRSR